MNNKILLIFFSLFFLGCSSIPKKKWNSPAIIKNNFSKLIPGDILIKKKGFGFLEYFGHCGILTEDNYIAEYPKIGYGLIFTPLEYWADGERKILVLRMKESSPEFISELLYQIYTDNEKPYKLFISKTNDSGYYCSQFIWNMYYKTSKKLEKTIDLDGDGGIIVFPYDFYSSKQLTTLDFSQDKN